jgi:hypothetical protein
MIPGKRYDPGTRTSRRPTPEEFAHLRRWVEVEEHNIDLTKITEIKNIDEQLNQFNKLYVSNVIERAIAQVTAACGDGFVTLEATEAGELKVSIASTVQKSLQAVINANTAATHEIIAAIPGKIIKIMNLSLTVGGETNLTLKSDTTAISGPMDFGGESEPRGMVHHFGDFPLCMAEGEAFRIESSGAVQLSGYVTYIIT